MSWFDKGFLAFYFLIIVLIQCLWQAKLIRHHHPIKHGWHGLYYALTVLPMVYFFSAFWWQLGVIAVVTRLAWFDIILNVVRNKRPILTYNGKGTTGSKIDQWENRFSTTWLAVLKVVYVIGFVVVLIILK